MLRTILKTKIACYMHIFQIVERLEVKQGQPILEAKACDWISDQLMVYMDGYCTRGLAYSVNFYHGEMHRVI